MIDHEDDLDPTGTDAEPDDQELPEASEFDEDPPPVSRGMRPPMPPPMAPSPSEE